MLNIRWKPIRMNAVFDRCLNVFEDSFVELSSTGEQRARSIPTCCSGVGVPMSTPPLVGSLA